MTDALTATQRTTLERLVGRARTFLEVDLAAQAAGRYGLDPDGTIADEDTLRLDPARIAARRELVDVIDHLRSEGESPAGAVARLTREAVFTHLNRFVAIRIAEALGLLPASLADGRRSRGFRDFLELAPLLAGDDTGGYWTYLRLCGDELAGDVPALFDPRNPLLALGPSPTALDGLVELLAGSACAELWSAPDCLGWVYQFFNRKEERDDMREASSAPRNSRELAVRNQFFTPRYVVDFLVQNTLGRRLVEGDPTGPLVEELTFLVDPPREPGPRLDLDQVSVLDPAVGSGHFLLGAFDVLERAWELAGVPPSEAAPHIVQSLWGVDIDVRAAQVASAAIMFRARRHCREMALPRPNIVSARTLPPADHLRSAVALTSVQRRTLDAVTVAMARAPELGSLLRVEAELAAEIRHAGFGPGRQATLELTDEAFGEEEVALLAVLQDLADEATSSAAVRLFVAEADDAIRFVEAMRRRYDVVLMNPPFGEPIADTKPYLRAAYPWASSRVDILTSFVGRGVELCKPEGYLGAITNRAGLFLTSFREWREEILLGNRLMTLADLGFGVMEQAMVEAAAYVIGSGPPPADHEGTFIRLLKDTDRHDALIEAISHWAAGDDDQRVYRLRLAELHAVPGSPIAYAMSPAIRRLFSELPAIGRGAEVKQGLATGDDTRFVRAFWEVDVTRVARSRQETHQGKRWVPFAKGGDYGPYWSDIHLVVDYGEEGERLVEAGLGRVQNTKHYFKPGLTWPRRTNSALSVRVLPAGCVFGDKGPVVLSKRGLPLLAWLNSRYVRLLIDATAASAEETQTGGVPSRSYEVGVISSLPDPTHLDEPTSDLLAELALAAAQARAATDELDETTRRFVAPGALHVEGPSLQDRAAQAVRLAFAGALEAIQAHDDADRSFGKLLDRDGTADDALYDADGPLVTDLTGDGVDSALLARPVAEVVTEATARCGIARWISLQHHVADRRLELAAVAEDASPVALLDASAADHLPAEEPKRTTDDVVSYLVGATFGRWDVRVGRRPDRAPALPDLFDAVPLCPPGMLVGEDGLPASAPPPDYPLELPPGRILLDQPGHAWDIEPRTLTAVTAVFDDPDAIVAELLKTLGRRSVRDHLRKRFFKDHLSRYSKSRRKAPIYWPLYVPSGSWGVWVYAPTLSRETLFAVAGAAANRLELAEAEIRRLQRERDSGGAGRSARAVADALADEESLVEELRRFRAEVERIAGLGWEPDLDDGIVLCAAPLANVFPAWSDAATERKNLKAGKYPWATVATWADQL